MEDAMYGGTQLMAIGALHTAVGLAMGSAPLRRMLAAGWIGTPDVAFDQMAIFWFLWFGWMLMLLGGAIRVLEQRGGVPIPLILATGAMCVAGGLSMPASGFWLGLAPVFTVLYRERIRAHTAAPRTPARVP